jgi:D-3-phosphoglycerate dehydrogenase
MTAERGKVMFIDTVHPILQEMLEEMHYKCDDFTTSSEAEIFEQLPYYQGAVIRSRFRFTRKLIDKAKALQFIARSGSGLENIDVEYAKAKNIVSFNSPEGNRDALGEHCVAMLLGLFNNINQTHSEIKQGIWLREKNRGVELKGKTVGIIGYGEMGRSFAEKLSGFGATVLAYDNNKTGFSSTIVKEVSKKFLHEQCDIISLHVNYTDSNYHLVNKDFLDSFKKSIYIINTARGKCVSTTSLIEALKSGKVLGACLDVLELEKTDFEISEEAKKILVDLSSFTQVLLTPHVGGWTNESYYKLSKILGDKIKRQFQKN